MWCCGVSKLHVCHGVLAEASITNSMSAAIDRSVLWPENWDMTKQMLWRNGTPSQRYPVLIPASPFFCFDKRRLTLSTVCKNPDVSLLGRKIESYWEQRPCTWSSMFEICIWFRVSARFVQLYTQKHAKAKKRWHPSTYIKLLPTSRGLPFAAVAFCSSKLSLTWKLSSELSTTKKHLNPTWMMPVKDIHNNLGYLHENQ